MFGYEISVPVTVPGERSASAREIVWVVMTVAVHQRFDSHPKEACSLPGVGASLHQPCRRGVPQHMRRDIEAQPSIGGHAAERLLDR